MTKQIIIATKNKGKSKEFKEFFAKYGIEAISLLELDEEIVDVEETGNSFRENAALKAETIANHLQQMVLADDSGLEVDVLDGKPGIYSARYAGEPTDDEKNIQKLLQELAGVPKEKRGARFVCTLAIAEPGNETIFRTGFCEGKISTQKKGNHGFGYDPVFVPENYNLTMAELPSNEKNKISHRKYAMDELEDWLEQSN
ncbi:XTP/dITP diphosphatase [Cerasibacillus terrae]|uniref:dITP/XTP pyrophosphatase n=1 Tax=Cerasibacillus terrae TaxID=2498845 RepID=A0A5C8NN22_9BACI|nr:XTP/dITP diphosphatase [Cerasibacillus terrae]TXL62556.1 XTP/dITP diphosphatase [Cerasibacillus terrae]